MSSENRRIRDPLHNLIEFNDELFERTLWDLLQTRPFQRLRRIKQLGFSDLVYPGATHTRFMHSLGVFHIARRLLARIRELMPKDFNQRNAESALAAALLHDIGHGPFSHAFETAADHLEISHAAKHEMMTAALIRKSEIAEILDSFQKEFSEQVAGILEPGTEKSDIYSAVVSSQSVPGSLLSQNDSGSGKAFLSTSAQVFLNVAGRGQKSRETMRTSRTTPTLPLCARVRCTEEGTPSGRDACLG